ncbi:MAG: MMPL family transporter [Solirubrobacterales bacterium]|nr:MMPL family transporter [Solirubrobacterales bacterium]
MQRFMDRLSGAIERRRRLFLAGWLVLLLAALPFAAKQTEHLTSGGFSVPGSGSEAVDRALVSFDSAQRGVLSVVVGRREGGDAAAVRAELDRVAAELRGFDGATLAPRTLAAAEREAARTPIAVLPLRVEGRADQVADTAVALRERLGVGDGPRGGAQTYLVGQAALWAGMQDLSKHDLERAEVTGFPIVLAILLAVFGSLVAASLPLLLGFTSVMITGAGIFFLSQATGMSVFVTNVASMIGIGVAVDYSLFILARYREEVRGGADPVSARRIAMRTSGVAVAFSGVTVMVSLAGLLLIDSQTLRSMAYGAIMVVAVSILAATTFLPALMAGAGRRAYEPGRIAAVVAGARRGLRRLARRPAPAPGAPGFWETWTDRVMRRPVVSAVAAGGLMLVLAIPALSLATGDGALRQFPAGHETRVGAELAAKKLGAGAASPIEVVATFERGKAGDPANRAALDRFAAAVAEDRGVAAVEPAAPSRDGSAAVVSVVTRGDAESPGAQALVDRLRAGASGAAALGEVARVDVGGATASVEDFRVQVTDSLWKIALFVLAFSYVVLLVLLRSVLLPLKAVLMNLLSVGAAYGVLVAIFQWGWIDGFLGFESLGYVSTMTPPLLLAIVFGLSMDYEVFLLSRIKERYSATGDTRRAVAEGLARSAATISSAALIMVAVFAVFAGVGVPSVKEIGVGLAVAIALDATIVRLVLVPATMEIMGRWNWWLPRPLDRVLPEADFESGGAADREPAAEPAPAPDPAPA